MSYTKKQHYLSRYIIKRFLNDNGKVEAVYVKGIKKIITDSKDICTENDFYEDKTREGEYINRNRTENFFANIESELAKKLEILIDCLNKKNSADIINDMCKNGEWDNLTVWLMLHLTLVLVRGPEFKDIIFRKKDVPHEIKQLFYKEYLLGNEEAKLLALNYFSGNELNIVLKELINSESEGCISILMNKLVNEYFIEIYRAPDRKKFFLTDNPVIVNEIIGIDYFLPISSEFAMCFKKIDNDKKHNIKIIPTASVNMVEGINSFLVENAKKFVIVKNMSEQEFDFIKGILDKRRNEEHKC